MAKFLSVLTAKKNTIVLPENKIERALDILKNGNSKNSFDKGGKTKFWMKQKGVQLVSFPEIGLNDVLVVPKRGKEPDGTMESYRRVVSESMLYDVVARVHLEKTVHAGYKKVKEIIDSEYYGIPRQFVQEFCKSCTCEKHRCKSRQTTTFAPIGQIDCKVPPVAMEETIVTDAPSVDLPLLKSIIRIKSSRPTSLTPSSISLGRVQEGMMPYLEVATNIPKERITPEKLINLSKHFSDTIGKPEQYCMVRVIPEQLMTVGGSFDPCAVASVMSLGKFVMKEKMAYTSKIYEFTEEILGIPSDRMYIQFTDKPTSMFEIEGTNYHEIFGQ